MSGFTPSLYRSRPTPSSFLLGYQGRGRFFYRFTCLLRHLSCSSHVLPFCGYLDSVSQYRPVPRPACSTRRAGCFMATGRSGYQAVIAAAVSLRVCLLAGRDCRLSDTGWGVVIDVIHLVRQCECDGMRSFSLFLPARPPLAGSLRLACLDLSPAPGRGMSWLLSICGCGRWVGLSAFRHVVPLSRSSLVRYCGSVRPAMRCCLVCSIRRLKRFNATAWLVD